MLERGRSHLVGRYLHLSSQRFDRAVRCILQPMHSAHQWV